MHHARPGRDTRAVDRTITALEERLRQAARPNAITDERVRAYCRDRGKPHSRFETVLLREAFKVVSAEDLIRRLVHDLRRRLRSEAQLDTTIAVPSLAHLAGLMKSGSEPAFLNLERWLLLGRLSQSTRVYLLYWQRLRDYLLWSVASI